MHVLGVLAVPDVLGLSMNAVSLVLRRIGGVAPTISGAMHRRRQRQ